MKNEGRMRWHRRIYHFSPGFTLIELLVVMVIAGAVIGLVAPRLIGAGEAIKAAAEEQKLADLVETVKMRAFLRQNSYTIEFAGQELRIKNEDAGQQFKFISFPPTTVTFNGNGFTEAESLRYIVRGREKVLHVS